MPTPDAHGNFAYSTIATAPSPATTGTSLVLTAGGGALMPAVAFNMTIWPAATNPLASNAEIVRVTNIATDTLTIVRHQEGTSARTVIVGDQAAATVTTKTLTDLETTTVRTVTGTDTIQATDQIVLLDPSGGAFNETLPTAIGFLRRYTLKAISTNMNVATLLTTSAQTIDGYASGVVTVGGVSSPAMYSILDLISDGSNWRIV